VVVGVGASYVGGKIRRRWNKLRRRQIAASERTVCESIELRESDVGVRESGVAVRESGVGAEREFNLRWGDYFSFLWYLQLYKSQDE
ncbi:hypothetical protein L195_g048935, partial [Trifolium pratense]